jgi:hypothetical protein
MQTMPGQPRGGTRLARALGLDGNPLRRATDRAEAWIRIGLLVVFLIAGPLAALDAGGWAYRTAAAAPTHHVTAVAGPAWTESRWQSAGASAQSNEALAMVMTLTFMALGLLVVQRLTLALLTRRRLAAWETAWLRVGPQWSGGRP